VGSQLGAFAGDQAVTKPVKKPPATAKPSVFQSVPAPEVLRPVLDGAAERRWRPTGLHQSRRAARSAVLAGRPGHRGLLVVRGGGGRSADLPSPASWGPRSGRVRAETGG